MGKFGSLALAASMALPSCVDDFPEAERVSLAAISSTAPEYAISGPKALQAKDPICESGNKTVEEINLALANPDCSPEAADIAKSKTEAIFADGYKKLEQLLESSDVEVSQKMHPMGEQTLGQLLITEKDGRKHVLNVVNYGYEMNGLYHMLIKADLCLDHAQGASGEDVCSESYVFEIRDDSLRLDHSVNGDAYTDTAHPVFKLNDGERCGNKQTITIYPSGVSDLKVFSSAIGNPDGADIDCKIDGNYMVTGSDVIKMCKDIEAEISATCKKVEDTKQFVSLQATTDYTPEAKLLGSSYHENMKEMLQKYGLDVK